MPTASCTSGLSQSNPITRFPSSCPAAVAVCSSVALWDRHSWGAPCIVPALWNQRRFDTCLPKTHGLPRSTWVLCSLQYVWTHSWAVREGKILDFLIIFSTWCFLREVLLLWVGQNPAPKHPQFSSAPCMALMADVFSAQNFHSFLGSTLTASYQS